jgi:periplasmic divalent cation tolerance protein
MPQHEVDYSGESSVVSGGDEARGEGARGNSGQGKRRRGQDAQDKLRIVKETDRIVVLITAGSQEEAHKIAEVLVKGKKAACVNIVPGVDSLFWWEGKIDSGSESLLLVKTKASLFPDIVELVKRAHSYGVPEIIALPIVAGNEDYLKWLDITCQ